MGTSKVCTSPDELEPPIGGLSVEPAVPSRAGTFGQECEKLHPNLRFRITTSGRRGQTFRSIIELGVYTSNAEPSVWYGWDDEESNRDITFVNRGGGTSSFGEGRADCRSS